MYDLPATARTSVKSTLGALVGSLAILIAACAFLLFATDPFTASAVLVAVGILATNVGFYLVEGRRRGDYLPFYPDSGAAIFFSMAALNALLLIVRAHRSYGSNPFTLGMYYPVPLPKGLVVRALAVVAVGNLVFLLAFYSRLGPAVVDRLPAPPRTSAPEMRVANRVAFAVLLFGLVIAFVGSRYSGPLFVVGRNLVYTVLPVALVVSLSETGPTRLALVATVGTVGVMLTAGHLSYIIVPVLSLAVCYHFISEELDIGSVTAIGISFVFVAIFGKQYRLRSELGVVERVQVSLTRTIVTFPELFARNVIARLSAFESFATIVFLVDTGRLQVHFGRQYSAFLWKLVPNAGGADTYFSGGYYTNEIVRSLDAAAVARYASEGTTASIGAFGSWYLNFHLPGVLVGVAVMAVIFRIWTQYLEAHTSNVWAVAFHASNVWFMYRFWIVNSRTTRGLLLHGLFLAGIFYVVRYSARCAVTNDPLPAD